MAQKIGSAYLFKHVQSSETMTEAKTIEQWSFPYALKDDLNAMMDYLYKDSGFQNHYSNYGISNVRIIVKFCVYSASGQQNAARMQRRVVIDTNDQWLWAKSQVENSLGELLVYIYGMGSANTNTAALTLKTTSPTSKSLTLSSTSSTSTSASSTSTSTSSTSSATSSSSTSTSSSSSDSPAPTSKKVRASEAPGEKRRRLGRYYEGRNETFDRARDSVTSDNVAPMKRTPKEQTLFDQFKKRTLKRFPNCKVLSEAKIKCGLCEKVITLSVIRGIRNYERHMDDCHSKDLPDPKQMSISLFTRRNATE